ncbi:hypothetical protein DM806_15485 [Sphingobium lactosutens]|nr:hypothetical protein [Sphingobium lactosutens]
MVKFSLIGAFGNRIGAVIGPHAQASGEALLEPGTIRLNRSRLSLSFDYRILKSAVPADFRML